MNACGAAAGANETLANAAANAAADDDESETALKVCLPNGTGAHVLPSEYGRTRDMAWMPA
eukprot:SAG22_NODE_2375_length_2643_cov_1.666274_2_plen_61_part_00